ncbi:MAG: heme ABC exporter, ATP-binding protein CcmA [Legionellales bacterium RIFCSPHIGHO2_12_FULL_37_14]|nr:MAG: heme ABC exporter, ATP-binding protein CcmA [Legionellales bacterium RIFCSPHIGHO2_12_FULL_37_14]
MIEGKNLKYSFSDLPLLNNINFRVNSGECLHIKGANGVGKSTLLNLITGIIRPQEGQVSWQGQPIYSCLPNYQSKLIYISHKLGLSSNLTILENLKYSLQFALIDQKMLNQGLEALNLQDCKDKLIATLSSGQQRKAALLRLWTKRFNIFILDEPLVSLDAEAIKVLVQRLKDHIESGGKLILTSHTKINLPKINILRLS